MPRETTLIGASGVVFWMGGAWLALYVMIEVRRTLKQRLLRALGVGLLLFFPSEAFDPQVSYLTHAVGFAMGLVSGLLVYFINRKKISRIHSVRPCGRRTDQSSHRQRSFWVPLI